MPFGPDAFAPEAFGAPDLLCCALELPVGIAGIALALRPRALRARVGGRWAAGFVACLVLVTSASGTALAASSEHRHTHEHGTSCPAAPVRTGVLDPQGVDTGVTAYFRCLLEHQHEGNEHRA
jgi:hypothetical protein